MGRMADKVYEDLGHALDQLITWVAVVEDISTPGS